MHKSRKSSLFDKVMAASVCGLLAFTLVIVFLATRGVTTEQVVGGVQVNVAPSRAPSIQYEQAPQVARLLTFTDRNDGSVVITDFHSSENIRVLEAGSGSFVRGVLRTLTRERRIHGVSSELPFELSQDATLGLVLSDPATETKIVLDAFGKTNTDEFRQLLAETNTKNGFATVATR